MITHTNEVSDTIQSGYICLFWSMRVYHWWWFFFSSHLFVILVTREAPFFFSDWSLDFRCFAHNLMVALVSTFHCATGSWQIGTILLYPFSFLLFFNKRPNLSKREKVAGFGALSGMGSQLAIYPPNIMISAGKENCIRHDKYFSPQIKT